MGRVVYLFIYGGARSSLLYACGFSLVSVSRGTLHCNARLLTAGASFVGFIGVLQMKHRLHFFEASGIFPD